MSKKIFLLLSLSIILSACSLMTNNSNNQDLDLTQPTSSPQPEQNQDVLGQSFDQENPTVAINTKYGQIVIKLFPEQSPNTVKNFLNKVNSGFYNGLIFHRVEPNFVVQGGDPLGKGTGGGQIASEINNLPFTVGSVGLARGGDIRVSNDSQFFICLSEESCQHLTGQYVNFGTVVSGINYVSQIQVGDSIDSITAATK